MTCPRDLAIKFVENSGIGVTDRVLAHENIEVAIGGEEMEGVIILTRF